MIKFNKISDLNYSVIDGSEEIINEVSGYVEKISKTDKISKDDYSSFSNDSLFYSILTRVISKYFLSTMKIETDVAMCIVEIRINDKTIYVSIGELPDIENNGENKFIDSNYSK